MGSQELRLEVAGGVLWIEMQRPERRNALDAQMRRALVQALEEARSPDIKVVVLAAAGAAFCAGADVLEMGQLSAADLERARIEYEKILLGLLGLPKPAIAALQGPAVGIGIALALACDLRYASPDFKLRPGFDRLELTADGGLSWLLPRVVGGGRAAELLLTGRELGCDEALAWGLVGEVVPDGLGDRVRAVATRLAGASPARLSATKRSLQNAWAADLAEAMDFEFLLQRHLLGQDEFRAAWRAFRGERR